MEKTTARSTIARYAPILGVHSICCVLIPLLVASGAIGLGVAWLDNIWLEAVIALMGAIAGVQLDKFIHRKTGEGCGCHAGKKASWAKKILKDYALPIIVSFLILALAHAIFPDAHSHVHIATAS